MIHFTNPKVLVSSPNNLECRFSKYDAKNDDKTRTAGHPPDQRGSHRKAVGKVRLGGV